MRISISFHEDEETLSRREEALDLLRKTTVDVGLTSKASGRSMFFIAIHNLQKAETCEAIDYNLRFSIDIDEVNDLIVTVWTIIRFDPCFRIFHRYEWTCSDFDCRNDRSDSNVIHCFLSAGLLPDRRGITFFTQRLLPGYF